MNNKKVLAVFVVHLVVLIAIQAQNTSPVLYAICENYNSGNHNEKNRNFQYGDIREFDTEHVTSDFGPRDYRTYDWHGGVDYSPEGSNEDFGEILQSVVPCTKVAKEQACVDKRCKTISYIRELQCSFFAFKLTHFFNCLKNDKSVVEYRAKNLHLPGGAYVLIQFHENCSVLCRKRSAIFQSYSFASTVQPLNREKIIGRGYYQNFYFKKKKNQYKP